MIDSSDTVWKCDGLKAAAKRRGWQKALSVFFVALIIIICLIFATFSDPDAAEFERKTSEYFVIGKTTTQIVEMFGPPIFKYGNSDDQEFTYAGPGGHYCRIIFLGGTSVRVTHWIK